MRGLACLAFVAFVDTGTAAWKKEPREPTSAIFEKLFRCKSKFAA
jgi:hypothetical protein